MSYMSYREYTQSKHPHIGAVPSHWNISRAKFLFRRENRAPGEMDEIVTAFRDGQVTKRSNRRTEGFTIALKEIGYQGIRKGDFIIHAMDGFAGAIGISDSDGKSSPVYSVCTPKDLNVVPAYYAKYLRTLALDGFIESLSKGVRERSTEFRFSEFKEVWFPLPPKSEQTQIVEFLDRETTKIDLLIEKQQELIKLLEEKRHAVISHAVTKGLNPYAPMKDSGVEWLGEVPEHWSTLQLKRLIAKVQTGNTPSGIDEHHFDSEGTAWYGPSDFTESLYLTDAARKLSESGKKEARIFPPMTVMLVGIGATIGKVSLTNIESSANQQINGICCKDSLDPIFCTYYLRTIKDYIVKCGKYTTMPIINQEETKNLVVTAPPIEEQHVIAKHIQRQTLKLDTLVEKAQSAIKLLKERRTALISAAVTGKIDVRDQVPQDVEEAVAHSQ